jgi:hypothetical protein
MPDKKHCFATHGLKNAEKKLLAHGDYNGFLSGPCDFSKFFENWKPIAELLAGAGD